MGETSRSLLQEAMRRYQAGFSARAALICGRVPVGDPHYPDALSLLGKIRLEQRRFPEAIRHLREALHYRPESADDWVILGALLQQVRESSGARNCFRRATLINPRRVDGLAGLFKGRLPAERRQYGTRSFIISPLDRTTGTETSFAIDLWHSGELGYAARRFRRRLVDHPTDIAALFNLGNVMRDLSEVDPAERLYLRTLCVVPRAATPLNNLGLLAFNRNDWAQAEARFLAASRSDPMLGAAWSNRARALQKLDKAEEALAPYKRGLLVDPSDLTACSELAGLMDAPIWARRALAINPLAPQPYNRLAILATRSPGRKEVLKWLRRGTVAEPADADAWFNISVELGRVGNASDAAVYGRRAVCANPRHASANFNTAFALLALERFDEGWDLHRGRFEMKEGTKLRRFFKIPEWTEDEVAGDHLLLWGEQGIGDEIQFLSLVPYFLDRGVKLTILTEPRLRPLLKRSFPGISVPDVSEPGGVEESHHGADCHLALGDLPHRLKLFCGGDVIPKPWLVPDEARSDEIRSGLQARHPSKKLVGITWRSIAPRTGPARTIAPAFWRDFASAENVALVSLQYGATEDDIAAFHREAGLAIDHSHGVEPFEDLDGLAALVAAVDLVICPVNNTVHFAGALSKPCWNLLPPNPDWRWGLSRPDSLWYPQTRVYRQKAGDEWDAVMTQVVTDLKACDQADLVGV